MIDHTGNCTGQPCTCGAKLEKHLERMRRKGQALAPVEDPEKEPRP